MATELTRLLTASVHGLGALEGESAELGAYTSSGMRRKRRRKNRSANAIPISTRKLYVPNGMGGYDVAEEITYYDPQMGGLFKSLKKAVKKVGKAVKKVAKGVKKVVKSDAFKKLALVGGAVTAGIFLGPLAAGAVKKVAGNIAARRAARAEQAETDANTASEAETAQHTTAILNDPGIIEAIRTGRIPPPPTSVGGSEFLDWATSIGMTALNRDQQAQMSAAERALLEQDLRSQMALIQQGSVQQLQRSPPPMPFSPSEDVPAEIQQVQAASLAGDNMKIAMMVGGGILAASLLSQRGRR